MVPTTTLQALVNIKRPSIKLTPLSSTLAEDHPTTGQTHGVEFDYDADAAQCSISVHALIPSSVPSASDEKPCSLATTVLFTQTYEGGFGKSLRLDDGAILELAKLDTSNVESPPSKDAGAPSSNQLDDMQKADPRLAIRPRPSLSPRPVLRPERRRPLARQQ